MKMRTMGKLGIQASAFGLGCMRFNGPASGDSVIDEQKAISLIRRAIVGGVTYLDTAYVYLDKTSEIVLGKALLDGGVQYLGGTCETYGNINASDSLWAVKHLVFDEKKYTLPQLEEAILHNFEGYEAIRHYCLGCDKYGNDLDTADGMANMLYEFVAKGIRDRGIQAGMQYFLIVIVWKK